MDNERKRTGTLVNFDLLPGLDLTAQGNPITTAQPIPYGVDHLIGFNELLTCSSTDGAGVHFYIDDYQFERFWRNPERYLRALLAFPLVVGPDFSLYTDYPEPLQRWNHYRNQMLTAWMQRQGVACVQSASSSAGYGNHQIKGFMNQNARTVTNKRLRTLVRNFSNSHPRAAAFLSNNRKVGYGGSDEILHPIVAAANGYNIILAHNSVQRSSYIVTLNRSATTVCSQTNDYARVGMRNW